MEGVGFELAFLIVLYVIDRVIFVINLDNSLYFNQIGHFTLYELHHNLKVSEHLYLHASAYPYTDRYGLLSDSLFLIDTKTIFLLSDFLGL
jgi:hypothetical protein